MWTEIYLCTETYTYSFLWSVSSSVCEVHDKAFLKRVCFWLSNMRVRQYPSTQLLIFLLSQKNILVWKEAYKCVRKTKNERKVILIKLFRKYRQFYIIASLRVCQNRKSDVITSFSTYDSANIYGLYVQIFS